MLNPIPTQTAQVGDVITLLVQFVDPDGVIIDLSAATSLQLILQFPDGTSQNFTATLYTDDTDGIIQYTTTPDDLNQFGYYFLQGRAVVGGAVFSTRNNKIDNVLYVYGNVD